MLEGPVLVRRGALLGAALWTLTLSLACGLGGDDAEESVTSPEPERPAPPIESATADVFSRGGELYVRFEVRTEPGAEVQFGSRRSMWPPYREVIADESGLAVYEPERRVLFPRGRRKLARITVLWPDTHYPYNREVLEVRPTAHLSCTSTSCTCEGGPTCRVWMSWNGETTLEGAAGTVIHVGEEEVTLGAEATEVDLSPDPLDRERIATAFGEGTFRETIPVRVEPPDREALTGELVLDTATIEARLTRGMERAAEGHGIEGLPRARGNAIYYLGANPPEFIGEVAGIEDVRYVATRETRERTAGCGSYRERTTGESQTVTRRYTDAVVTLYDIRNGRRVSRTTIRAPSVPCPERTTSTQSRSRYEGPELMRWLERRAR